MGFAQPLAWMRRRSDIPSPPSSAGYCTKCTKLLSCAITPVSPATLVNPSKTRGSGADGLVQSPDLWREDHGGGAREAAGEPKRGQDCLNCPAEMPYCFILRCSVL